MKISDTYEKEHNISAHCSAYNNINLKITVESSFCQYQRKYCT